MHLPPTRLVDELHVASHARDVRLAGGRRPQEHGVVVRAADQPLRLPLGDGVVALLRHLSKARQAGRTAGAGEALSVLHACT